MAKRKKSKNPKVIDNDEESWIKIRGFDQAEITGNRDIGFGDGVEIETDEGDFIVFEDSDAAGEAAREYWVELLENDPEEFRTIVGDENLINWALGRYAGPGAQKTESLEAWLDLWLNNPEEQWASYDGEEQDVESLTSEAETDIGFIPKVAYRTN